MTVDQLIPTVTLNNQTWALKFHELVEPEEKFDLLIRSIHDFGVIINSRDGLRWGPQVERQQAGIDGILKGRFNNPIAQLWFMWNANQREQMFFKKDIDNAVSQMRPLGQDEKHFVRHDRGYGSHGDVYRRNTPDDFSRLITDQLTNPNSESVFTVEEKTSSPGSLLQIITSIRAHRRSQHEHIKKTNEYLKFVSDIDSLDKEDKEFWEVALNRISRATALSLYGCITPASVIELKRVISTADYNFRGDILLFDLMANAAPLAQLADIIDGNTSSLRSRIIPATTDLGLFSEPFGHNIKSDIGIIDIVGPYMKDEKQLSKTVRRMMMDGIRPGGVLIFRDLYRKPIDNNAVEDKTISSDMKLANKREGFINWLNLSGFKVSSNKVKDVLDNLWGPDRPRDAGLIHEPYEQAFADLRSLYPGSKLKLFTVGIKQYPDVTDGYYIIGVMLKGNRYLYEKTDSVRLPEWAEK